VSCAVALWPQRQERIAFNTLNKATDNRVKREFVDGETGELVERDDQIKGYQTDNGQYIVLESEEVTAATRGVILRGRAGKST
jgi:DNA end-binding protein Ku